ncbi:MAG: sugar ABC transporter permease [Clostridia bacterium]|nr:sugar ABC transporter permease [Clostridia bacterium]
MAEQSVNNCIGKNSIMPDKKRKLKKGLFMASFLAWPILNFFVFYVYVHLDSFAMAFQKELPGGQVQWTFDHFRTVWQSLTTGGGASARNIGIALRNTFLFYGSGVLVVLPLSLLMGYFFHKKITGYKIFRVVTYFPVIITSVALVTLFKYTFSDGGLYHAYCIRTGKEFINPITNADTSIWMMVMYSILFGFGSNIVVWGGAMNSISPDVLEAGELDGCNWFQEFYLLIIPMIWPTISTVILLGTISCLGGSGPVLAFTRGEYDTYTLGYMLYEMVGRVDGMEGYQNFHLASALGLCMTCVSFPIAMIVKRLVYSEKKEKEMN